MRDWQLIYLFIRAHNCFSSQVLRAIIKDLNNFNAAIRSLLSLISHDLASIQSADGRYLIILRIRYYYSINLNLDPKHLSNNSALAIATISHQHSLAFPFYRIRQSKKKSLQPTSPLLLITAEANVRRFNCRGKNQKLSPIFINKYALSWQM